MALTLVFLPGTHLGTLDFHLSPLNRLWDSERGQISFQISREGRNWMEKMQSPRGQSTVLRSAVGCLLGLQIFAALFPVVFGEKVVLGKEGSKIYLPCLLEKNMKVENLKWFKKETLFLNWDGKQVFKGSSINNDLRFDLDKRTMDNGNFSMIVDSLKISDAGDYKCTFQNKIPFVVHLFVFQLHASPGNPLLLSENLNLTLQTYPQGHLDLKVTWKDPNNQDLNITNKTLQINNLSEAHKGDWRCWIHHPKSAQDLEITHKVRTTGFIVDSGSGNIFSKVNGSVVIACKLLFEIKSQIESLQVRAAGVYKSDNQETLGQLMKEVNISERGSCWKGKCGDNSPQHRVKDLSESLTNVQFSDAGWYTCLVKFNRSDIQMKIQLVIVRVSVMPQGLLTINSEVNLTCEVSARLPNAVVRWTHVNGSSANSKEGTNRRLLTLTLRVNASHFGLWRCSILVDGQVLLSMDQKLEGTPDRMDLWFWVAVVAGSFAILLLTICTVICIARERRRGGDVFSFRALKGTDVTYGAQDLCVSSCTLQEVSRRSRVNRGCRGSP
uniref:T-cell surface glycoprotein CD4-like n=1 Tax=Geotrypetes seraphini TaxID=260995 RepID=A0A6P8Q040_GEOSA|nr:T-cell surface glycoprotein CD4-like [Geotrypetes seraphini]